MKKYEDCERGITAKTIKESIIAASLKRLQATKKKTRLDKGLLGAMQRAAENIACSDEGGQLPK